jgi:hypothetical protein
VNRRDLDRPGIQVLNRGGFGNPDVLRVPTPRGPVVVKDYAYRSWPVRQWLAPLLLRHEGAMLRRAAGLPGLPSWSEQIDRHALAMEYLEGRSLRRRWHTGALPPSFFDALEGILEGLASRGLVHLDLRSPSNMLLTPTGAPAVVDLAAVFALPIPRHLRRWLERQAIAKLRRRLGSAEFTAHSDTGPWEAGASGLDLVVHGVRWRRYEAGSSDDPVPAVLLPDLGIGGRVFTHVMDGAAKAGRRAIAVDLPGSGGSAHARLSRNPFRVARGVEALLGALRLGRVDLVGLGYGGVLARWVAASRPDRIRTLVTVDTPVARLSPAFRDRVQAAGRSP